MEKMDEKCYVMLCNDINVFFCWFPKGIRHYTKLWCMCFMSSPFHDTIFEGDKIAWPKLFWSLRYRWRFHTISSIYKKKEKKKKEDYEPYELTIRFLSCVSSPYVQNKFRLNLRYSFFRSSFSSCFELFELFRVVRVFCSSFCRTSF